MHYCNWNVSDYASHTGHLSPLEDIAYRRMLDLYYLHEKPLPRNARSVAVAIRMAENEKEVRTVLSEFFVRSAHGYTNKRADEEILRYREKIEQASNAGRASAQRRCNGRSTDVQRSNAVVVEPTNPSTQEPGTNPLPPAVRGTSVGAIAPRPEPEVVREPWGDLHQRLLASPYRSLLKKQPLVRGIQIREKAEALAAAGMTLEDLNELIGADAAQADEPGGLLATWIDDSTWRDELGERHRRRKEAAAAQRTAASSSGDPLAGVYGE